MNRLALWVRAFFGFSRMETNGFLLLIPMMVALLFSGSFYRAWVPPSAWADPDRTDSLLAWMENQETERTALKYDTIAFHPFDPNTVTENELAEFGLDRYLIDRWLRYRVKGGKFKSTADVQKLYGLDSIWFAHAEKWMQFSNRQATARQERRAITRQDINAADSLSLLDVYGIGPALARRILLFRSRLGGFVSMEQLAEVYGLDTAVVFRLRRQFQVMPGFEPRKIDLQSVTFEELARHPYVSRRQAQALVSYRSQHGLSAPQDLGKLNALDSAWLARMLPYLKAPLP